MDLDNLILNDLRPLLGFDFAYASGSRLNGAILGTSGPRSPFMRAAIEHAATTYETGRYPTSHYRFADDLFKDLSERRREKNGPPLFLKLSGCLFESRWGGTFRHAPSYAELWSEPATPENEEFFLDPSGVFTYHWHGHWGYPIRNNSFGSVAHSNYVRELQLDPSIFRPVRERSWSRPN